MPKKRVHVYYRGMVHGVGFRYTAEHIARKNNVIGWVKNLPDGRVELLGEGEEDVLKDFLKDIRNGPLEDYIRDQEVTWSEATGEFKNFGIRFY